MQHPEPPCPSERSALRLVKADRSDRPISADEVIREGARIFADYLTRRLPDVDETDPGRHAVEDLASRYGALAG